MAKQYKKVAVGGTFDKFHYGHRKLIGKAFEIGDEVGLLLCGRFFFLFLELCCFLGIKGC